jgi:hypothetical protein
MMQDYIENIESIVSKPPVAPIGHNSARSARSDGRLSGPRNVFTLSRDIFNHPYVGAGNAGRAPWNRMEAWIWLIARANFRESEIDVRGDTVSLRRGQLVVTLAALADRWGWSIKQVRTFLDGLQDRAMINRETGTPRGSHQTLVTLCNYDIYQFLESYLGQPKRQPEGNSRAAQRQQSNTVDTENKERGGDLDPQILPQTAAGGDLFAALPPREHAGVVEVNGTAIRAPGIVIPFSLIDASARSFKIEPELAREIAKGTVEGWVENGIKPDNPPAQITAALRQYRPTTGRAPKVPKTEYTHDFNCFWEAYPRKEGKGEAFNAWLKLTLEQKRTAYAALKKQLSYLKSRATHKDGNMCPHAQTWLRQGRFDDEPKIHRTHI